MYSPLANANLYIDGLNDNRRYLDKMEECLYLG